MSHWVKCHDSLRKGSKRDIPRALRFVYLELCLEAYDLHGEIVLSRRLPLVDAVHDVLGGNRREIAAALDVFMAKPSDSADEPALQLVESESKRMLIVTNWSFWNGKDVSTERVRRHRKNKNLGNNVTVSETLQPVSVKHDETVLEERRGEEKRSSEQHAPPARFDDAGSKGKPKRGTRLPDDWEPNPKIYGETAREFGFTDADVRRVLLDFRDYWTALPGQRGVKLNWDTTFRGRLRTLGVPVSGRRPIQTQRHAPDNRKSEALRATEKAIREAEARQATLGLEDANGS